MSQVEDLIEVAHFALGVKRTLSLWGRKSMRIIRRDYIYRSEKLRKFHKYPAVRLYGNQRKQRFAKILLEKGVSVLDCILFARVLPAEIVRFFEKD